MISAPAEKGEAPAPSYYEATRAVDLNTTPLDGDITVDVAIIGGGITGCSAALELAERGVGVALLEARDIGWGASGRNGGQVLPGYAIAQHKLARMVGAEDARLLWNMSVEATKLVEARIRAHAIPADYTPGYFYAAIKHRHVAELEEEAEALAKLGVDGAKLVRGADMGAHIASTRYLALLTEPMAAHLHPLNYTLGLGLAAQTAGAKIVSRTPVTAIEEGAFVRLRTPRGTVTAKTVLVVGGAYLGRVWPQVAGYVMPVGTYIVATEPRDDVADLLPRNEAVADLNFVLDYFRRSADNRLLFGGRVSYSAVPPPRLGAVMLARARAVFPQLAGARAEFAWGGLVDITRHRAPHFGRLAPNILMAQGFSGHGVALAGLAGRVLAEAAAGQAGRFDVFSRIPQARFPGGRALRVPALLLATSYYRLRDML
ncbi:FAD-binding oxidoreductase [Acidisoma cellulosilytica]|uniref:FAD-binding oxidoreductase n=1 Tax=Acidisoma cellulosilyticum TaxID=2802395 RepID=A0A963Z6K7_9PROT|nr:FAD-binding oxidoreductase [Acidisoma cellulosilyticum]MCB8882807.1 FAD-binding oxidoreductase [Acidisoma cellulosilyticum]